MAHNPYAQYKKMEVTTNDPVKLVVMLYDGAIVAMRRAIEHIKAKQYEQKCKELMRAHDILFELLACLDREKGGEIATNLEALYSYMLKRILEVNVELDLAKAEEVIRLLNNINEGWRELARRNAAGQGSDVPSKAAPTTSDGALSSETTVRVGG